VLRGKKKGGNCKWGKGRRRSSERDHRGGKAPPPPPAGLNPDSRRGAFLSGFNYLGDRNSCVKEEQITKKQNYGKRKKKRV